MIPKASQGGSGTFTRFFTPFKGKNLMYARTRGRTLFN